MSMHDDPRSVTWAVTVRSAGWKPFAFGALVPMLCIGLPGCGGGPVAGGSGRVGHPDLVVESPLVSDDRPAAGAALTFSATVRNAGRGAAAATKLRVYRSDDGTITPADEQVGTATVAALAASESVVAAAKVPAPPNPGTYHFGACVDPVAGESGTANNCSATVRVIVPLQDTEPAAPRPDLVVEPPTVSLALPAAGTSFTFSATVRNAGGGDAAATTLRVYRSDDGMITPADEQVGAATVAALAASESMVASLELSAPSSSGTYYFGACVRAVADESDTANNCSAPVQVTGQAVQVTRQAAPRPDLIAAGPWVNNANPAIGGVFVLSAEVRNRGPTTALQTTLRFYRSTDATIARSDTQVAAKGMWLGTNRHNQEVYVPVYVKVPSSSGVYYYGACVDAVARESDTTNNCSAATKVSASHNKPDLRVNSWGVWLPRPAGTALRVAIGVSNTGGPSEATTLRLLLVPHRTSAPAAGTQVGASGVPALVVTQASPASSRVYVVFQAPSTAGWYHYVACVDAVSGDSDTSNDCSRTAIEFS